MLTIVEHEGRVNKKAYAFHEPQFPNVSDVAGHTRRSLWAKLWLPFWQEVERRTGPQIALHVGRPGERYLQRLSRESAWKVVNAHNGGGR